MYKIQSGSCIWHQKQWLFNESYQAYSRRKMRIELICRNNPFNCQRKRYVCLMSCCIFCATMMMRLATPRTFLLQTSVEWDTVIDHHLLVIYFGFQTEFFISSCGRICRYPRFILLLSQLLFAINEHYYVHRCSCISDLRLIWLQANDTF